VRVGVKEKKECARVFSERECLCKCVCVCVRVCKERGVRVQLDV
jgi:hypothetical protein